MAGTLTIKVIEWDDDYLALGICGSNERFAGSTRVYAGLDELTELADFISGFPQGATDERRYEFGSQEPGIAGGFCSLRFYCIDSVGHARLGVVLIDDDTREWHGSASFGFPVFAADIDRFVLRLRQVKDQSSPEAILETVY